MNRRERRRHATLNRGRRTGYLHRILGLRLRPGVHITTVEHDGWCGIYRDRGCDCVPNTSVSCPDGDVTIIDERGEARRVRKQ